jgi:hypothetical protein
MVLYGNSVLLAGIKAELEADPGIELIAVDAGSSDVMERIAITNRALCSLTWLRGSRILPSPCCANSPACC